MRTATIGATFVLAAVSTTTAARADEPLPPLQAEQQPSAPVAPAPAKSSVRVTVESEARAANAAVAGERPAPQTSIDDAVLLHGFRFGYGYIFNYDQPAQGLDGESLKQRVGLRTPHHFLLGYEVVYRVTGHSWLNVLLMGNGMVAGLEQSKVLPTANLLIGFEFKNSFQVGVGASLSPLRGSEAHTIVAAGWTPRVGTIYTPVHFFFVPDVDGVHRMGLTTGVTF